MDTKITQKINALTNGLYAKAFFTQNGLNYSDAETIRNNLINKAINDNLKLEDVEMEIIDNIQKYNRNFKRNSKDSYTHEEKKFVFDLNNNRQEFTCPNCKNKILQDFKFCPKCGKEVEHKELILIANGEVNLEKGYVTTEELSHLRLVTPDENEKLSKENIPFDEIGIPLTPENCPFEIRDEIISDTNSKDDKEARRKNYEKNIKLYRQGIDQTSLSSFNEQELGNNKKFPVNKSKIPQPTPNDTVETNTQKTVKRKITEETVKTEKPVSTKTKTSSEEEKVDINLEYAAVLYLLDIIKHPKKPKVSDSILYWLGVSSNRKITNYLKKNDYMAPAEDYDLIRANLQQKKVSDLKKILSKNDLKVSGRKDDLIDRICNDVPKENLKTYSKGKAMKVTSEGQKFIDSHPHVETYAKYLKKFNLSLYEEFYNKNTDLDNIELALNYLDVVRDLYADKMEWYNFSMTYPVQTKIYNDIKNYERKLESYINEFICALNPWTDCAINLNYSYPITMNMQTDIIKLLDDYELDTETLKKIFIEESEKIKLPGLFLEAEDMFNYFIRTYEEEVNLDAINEELSNRFDRSSLKNRDVIFTTKEEQNEKYELVKKYFN